MKIKRVLVAFLLILMIPSLTAVSVYATDSATERTQTSTTSENKKKVKETEPPVNSQTLGMDKYINYLEKRTFSGELGALYTKKKTTFKLWAPTADSVKVCIYTKGTDGEDGAQMISKTNMVFVKKYGTWVLELEGDYKNKYYTYIVTINGFSSEVVDPYAKAVGANGNRGMIVDLDSTDPKGWNKDKFNRVDSATDAVIWEINVRDFSASQTSGVTEENRGKFLAFTEQGTVVDSVEGSLPTCIDYLKDLGVNYVQINPFYDFASIDETDMVNPQYNWGYDPKNYNVPEGSFSSDPFNGNVRITECKQMIQALHKAGIGVIMDVVYNHTYASKDSWFNLIVPDYYYRIDDEGNWSNGSGCGNDTASERTMFRKYMIDSVVYWAKEYHIDGFRFDLMGLHDVKTMNEIRSSLDKLNNGEKIIMYGEAWNLDTNCASSVTLANQNNISKFNERIGAFNDTFRDGLKGNVFDSKDTGFIQSGKNKSKVKSGIEGMSTPGTWGTLPSQSINYASCHDNLSLYDKLVASVYPDQSDYRKRREDLVMMNKLSAAITLTSQGVPFMMAGEEFARSKDGDENSYISPVEVNQIDWYNINKYADLKEYYKGLIDIRQTVDFLTDGTGEVANSISYIEGTKDSIIAYTIKGEGNTRAFCAVFNGLDKRINVNLPYDVCSQWVRIADENTAGIRNLEEITDFRVTVEPYSCAILVDKDSFDKYENADTTSRVVVKYYDSKTDAVVFEQIVKGDAGKNYSISHPEYILYNYNVISVNGSLDGKFASDDKEIVVHCRQYSGEYSSVIFHFVDENGDDIANSVVMKNRVGQHYTTPKLYGIDGYRIDLDNLPQNGAGEYTDEEITVIYQYKPIDDLSQADLCIANVIYMSDDGEILDTKSYSGDKDDKIVIEYIDIPGYSYISDTADGATFKKGETNIVITYEKQRAAFSVIMVISVVVLVSFVVLAIVLLSKRRRFYSYDEYDDLYIE